MSNNAFRALTVLVLLVVFSSALLLAIGAPVMLAAMGGPLGSTGHVIVLWVVTGVSGIALLNRMGVL